MKVKAMIVLLAFAPMLVHAAPASTDAAAPRVLHEVVQRGVIGHHVEIRARLQDQSDIFDPKVYFRRVGEAEYNTIDFVRQNKDEWLGIIPATFVTRDLEYFLEAYDIMGNGPARHGGPDRPHLVRISTRGEPSQPRQIDTRLPASGKMAPVTATASAEPVTKKWWFWTIIGVAAAGVVAGASVGIYYAVKANDNASFNTVTVRIAGTDPREGL